MDLIKLLLLAGANVNNQNRWSIMPLLSAFLNPYDMGGSLCRMTLACLIDSGANVNCRDADGKTPLMYAAKFGDGAELAQMLIQAGADPYAIDNEGFTVLHHSCLRQCPEVVQYLLKIAPCLLLLRGKPSLACLAPYLTIFHTEVCLGPIRKHVPDTLMGVFLDDPNCPSAIKFDINVLRVVHYVFCFPQCLNSPKTC